MKRRNEEQKQIGVGNKRIANDNAPQKTSIINSVLSLKSHLFPCYLYKHVKLDISSLCLVGTQINI